jgi:glutamyl-tRNA synthetase
VSVRVRFAPSPTGSLHLGNALTAVVNRRFADDHGGTLVLRIDDTDPTRTVQGGEQAILGDLEWLEIDWDDGPLRQSDRAPVHAVAAERAENDGRAIRDADGSLRLDGVTLLRPDGSATYQLATVADDIDLAITHVIRGSDHRPNEELQRRIARAIGGELPTVIHHGLLLGEDGRKLSKRHGHASVADLRDEGIPATALRAYLEELGLPSHDVQLDRARIGRLAIDAITAMSDEELAAVAGAPTSLARALRGARTLVEAREMAHAILEPEPAVLPAGSQPTLERFAELRAGAPEVLDEARAREIVRELKAVGGDLRTLRLALTGRERGPELWTVVAALPTDEALDRVRRAAVSG